MDKDKRRILEDLEKGLSNITDGMQLNDNPITYKQLASVLNVYTTEIIRSLSGLID